MLTADHEGGGRGSPRRYTAEQLCSDRVIGYLRGQNASGKHVYVRPDSGYVLVDDVDPDRGPEPWCAAIIRTSPASAQWWVRVGSHPASAVARHACAVLGGDVACSDVGHYGRLVGLTNRKERHRDATGRYPWVAFQHANPQALPYPLGQIEAAAAPIPTPPQGGGIAHASATGGSQSERDWAYACWLIEQGRAADETTRLLAEFRRSSVDDRKADRDDYLRRTVERAAAHVGRGMGL